MKYPELMNLSNSFQEGVGDIFPDIKFKLTYKIVEKTPPTPSSPTEVPSLVPYAVFDPSKPQEETAVVGLDCSLLGCAHSILQGATYSHEQESSSIFQLLPMH